MSLARYIEREFGVRTRSYENPVTSTVATTVTQILRNNPDRFSYTIINLDVNAVFIAFDKGVSLTRGILITANGGSLTLSAKEDGELVGYDVFAISDTAASEIFTIVTEGE